MARYAELHPFADDAFVSGGFTHFVWGCFDYDGENLPQYRAGFGMAVDVTSEDPEPVKYARYNPSNQTWDTPLADDAVPELMPFHTAQWNNTSWIIAAAPEE